MASNVSNLLKEKIVTPVANSLATQVDNKVKNGIILRKFIGVQLGESNTGCQLVKIDLNKINVKDPSYEFTLYIKAFSQKGLFNFIINVSKTDSLQVDVKCEVKNSDSINGEVIGYYDVDAVGNTITVSLVKAFVVNTSINECKFVSTKDTLMISDLDIDWSDTGNIKTTSSINIKYEKTYSLNIKQHLSQDDVGENEAYRIAKFDLSKFAETDFGGNYSPDIYVQLLSWKFGYQYLFIRPLWANSSKRILLVVGTSHIETNSNIMINDNIKDVFNFSKIDDNTIGIYYSPSTLSIAKEDAVKIISYTVHGVKTYEPEDNIVVDWTCVKESIASLHLFGFSNYELDFNRIFTPNDDSWIGANGIVPHPTTSEADNKYLLGADAKWHPRKAGNEYIANLKPTEEIKGLSETDTTKGISFVTIDFNTLSQKVVEAAPSTTQDFMINMKVLTYDLGIITISTKLGVTTAGLVACNGVLSDRGMGSRSVSFSTTYSGKLGAVTSPGFFVNDKDTKIFKIALYTPIAIDGVKIIDAVVTSYSDIITESDIVFTWELGILEKKPYKPLTSNIIYPRIDLDRELVFDQMDIETPISETDEDTLFAEQIKHNGLVPAPGKYEVDNQYFLKADGSWDLPKRGNNNFISIVTPREEMTSQVSSTVGITFATFDYSKIIESLSLAVNTGSGFEGVLIINTKLFGEILINFSVSLFNLNGTINKGATAYANVGTKSTGHHSQISLIQNTYGADIKTPVFIYTDSVNNICKIGLYGLASKSPVIIKDCTLNQTYTDFDVNDITITWEPTTISISEENTNDAPLFTNMDWSKIFTPIANMTDPDGSYSENNVRRWKLQNNGLVPAPTKYEADQGFVLCADGTWIKPGLAGTEDDIKRAYILRPDGSWGEQGYDVSVSDIVLDPSFMMGGSYLRVMSIDISDLWEDTSSMKTDLINVDFRYEMRTSYGLAEGELTAGLKFKSTGELEQHMVNLYYENIYPYDMYGALGCGGINVDRTNKKIDLYVNPWNITTGDQESYRIKSAYCSIGGNTKPSIDLTPTLIESSTLTEFVDAILNDRILGFKTFETWDITGTYEDSPSSEIPNDLDTLYNLQRYRYNGLVPSPSPKDVENGCFLNADGTWGPIKGIIRNRTFTVTPHTDSSSTQTNDYAITEDAEDLAIAINENYSVDINIVFSGLGSKNNTNTTLRITGVTGTVNLYDYSGNPIKYITDGMSMKCTIFKNTIDDPVESMNAYCIYDIVSYPDTINGPSE